MTQKNNYNLQDVELVEAINNDDHEAFKNLYYKYFPALIRFAYYRLHSAETASDLVQEVFLRVWIKRARLNPDKSIKAYLYKSLNNQIINHLKLSSSKTSSIERSGQTKNLISENNIDFNIDFREAIRKLPDKLKTVYVLSRVEGYKYIEIAEICNISVKAVEKRMSKAFDILRKIFSE